MICSCSSEKCDFAKSFTDLLRTHLLLHSPFEGVKKYSVYYKNLIEPIHMFAKTVFSAIDSHFLSYLARFKKQLDGLLARKR